MLLFISCCNINFTHLPRVNVTAIFELPDRSECHRKGLARIKGTGIETPIISRDCVRSFSRIRPCHHCALFNSCHTSLRHRVYKHKCRSSGRAWSYRHHMDRTSGWRWSFSSWLRWSCSRLRWEGLLPGYLAAIPLPPMAIPLPPMAIPLPLMAIPLPPMAIPLPPMAIH